MLVLEDDTHIKRSIKARPTLDKEKEVSTANGREIFWAVGRASPPLPLSLPTLPCWGKSANWDRIPNSKKQELSKKLREGGE